MTRKNWKTKCNFLNGVLVLIVIVVLTIPTISSNNNIAGSPNLDDYNEDSIYLETQSFSRYDYEPILEEEKQGLGNITISNMDFSDIEILSFHLALGEVYPIFDDYFSNALNLTFKGMKFISTVRNAQSDNLNPNITDNFQITVRVNESVGVWANLSKEVIEGYLIYGPRLYPSRVKELFVQRNDTNQVIQCNETDNYIIDQYNFLKFEYEDLYTEQGTYRNFTMHIIWEYNLTISNWKIFQDQRTNILLKDEIETISPKFSYSFDLTGKILNQSQGFQYSNLENMIIGADNIEANITFNPPDRNLLKNHELWVDGSKKTLTNHLNNDKTLFTGLEKVADVNLVMNFTSDFTVKFNGAVSESWAVDRLIDKKDRRERLYFPSIISGPSHLYVKYLYINEDSISIDQVKENSTLFGRSFAYFASNVSKYDEEQTNSLVFTENATQKQGLKVFLPFLIKDEVCPMLIKYQSTKNLKIIITDNIQMPLANLEVKLYFYDLRYGTYMSKDKIQPMAPQFTDDQGEVNILFVPIGNFTIKVYQADTKIWEASVSTFVEINYVVTDRIHFPLWILIFSSINGILILLGVAIHFKYKKK